MTEIIRCFEVKLAKLRELWVTKFIKWLPKFGEFSNCKYGQAGRRGENCGWLNLSSDYINLASLPTVNMAKVGGGGFPNNALIPLPPLSQGVFWTRCWDTFHVAICTERQAPLNLPECSSWKLELHFGDCISVSVKIEAAGVILSNSFKRIVRDRWQL